MKSMDINYKILSNLRENCKMTYKELAKEVGSNINTVAQKIKKLEEEGYILGYSSHIDYRKLGYCSCAIVKLKLDKGDSIVTEKIQDILSLAETSFIYSIAGPYDLAVYVEAKNHEDLVFQISQIGRNPHITNLDSEVIVKNCKFFADFNPLPHGKRFLSGSKKRKKALDELDYAILRDIRNGAKNPLREFSNKLNAPISTIKERTDKMEMQGIIKKCVADLNFNKLGYWGYAFMGIKLESNYMNDSEVFQKLMRIPELGSFSRVLGQYDFYAGALIKSPEHATEIVKSLSSIKGIKKIDPYVSLKMFKTRSKFNPLSNFRMKHEK
jgi:Lrp/AsnC family leucine-responsive transcriptional regulator